MDRLWAPWRIEYILSEKKGECIFCVKPSRSGDRKRLILYRSQWSTIMMNRFPYTSGHLMVAPMKHTSNLDDLTPEELTDLFLVLRKAVSLLRRAIAPEGFNIGMNIGQIAGAGIADHLHFHVVPRWSGDTNFMPVLSGTTVVPESLDKTFGKLLSVLKEMDREK
ncbi:MAG: HIT domain-containing protein [Deltaproteobacteria bacterium]|nr:HIT domain-containing protein [Deltaproteobacteria bacterium]MBW2122315.1 HIT domain-containing protein [Deltaproteobacteria bacterium]